MDVKTDLSLPPDLGILTARLMVAVQQELYGKLAHQGFSDLRPRHGTVLAYLRPEGVRASELAQLSGQSRQIIGTIIDELEELGYVVRCSDQRDRRAKLIVPTDQALAHKYASDAILKEIEEHCAKTLGNKTYTAFKDSLAKMVQIQRDRAETNGVEM